MRKFRLTIVITTEDNINPEEITLRDSDVVDGFEITRDADDITEEFLMTDAYIEKIEGF